MALPSRRRSEFPSTASCLGTVSTQRRHPRLLPEEALFLRRGGNAGTVFPWTLPVVLGRGCNLICGEHGKCQLDLNGSQSCACDPGFSVLPNRNNCSDVDECLTKNGSCPNNTNCLNYIGSFECRCNPGYNKTSSGDCVDIDECNVTGGEACGTGHQCINTEGSFRCLCLPGYELIGLKCVNIDSCKSNTYNCPNNSFCQYVVGGYQCICNSGFKNVTGTCADIDECHTAGLCSGNRECVNTIGSYSCQCKSGFTANDGGCTDVDECLTANSCSVNATCKNYPGSYNCTCKTGFKGDGRMCSDVDECATANNCSVNARCTNSIGSYSCSCKGGFQGDGKACVDVNECDSKTNPCPSAKVCVNTEGSFNCKCQSDGCAKRNCYNSGSCQLNDNCVSSCNCQNAYTGADCSRGKTVVPAIKVAEPPFKVIVVVIKVTNRDYSDSLEDRESEQYRSFETEFMERMRNLLMFLLSEFFDFSISRLWQGSIVAKSEARYIYMPNRTILDFYSKSLVPSIFSAITESIKQENGSSLIFSVPNITDVYENGTGITAEELLRYYKCNTNFSGYTLSWGSDGGLQCQSLCANASYCGNGTNMECVNLQDGAVCQCSAGFEMKPDNSSCTDTNECLQPNACSPDATCSNRDGRYTCTCNEGFIGNGMVCERTEACLYVPGARSCSCRPGTQSSGSGCVDIDECQNKTACSPNAQCLNTYGSFTCVCNGNYTAVAQSCRPRCSSVPCPGDPCLNGGACYVDGAGGGCDSAKCSCTPVTQGDKCQFGTLTVPVYLKPGAVKVKYTLSLWFISQPYANISDDVKADLTKAVIDKLKTISGFNSLTLQNASITPNSTVKSNCTAYFDYPLDSSIRSVYNGTQEALIRSRFGFGVRQYQGNILLDDIQQTVVPLNHLDQVYDCNTTFEGYTLIVPDSGPVCQSPCADNNYCSKRGECQHLQTGAVCVCNTEGIYQATGAHCEEVTLISRVFFAILFGTLSGVLVLLLLAGLLVYLLNRRNASDRFNVTASKGSSPPQVPSFSRTNSFFPWLNTMLESKIMSDANGIKTLFYRDYNKPDPRKEVCLPRPTVLDKPATNHYE